MRTKPEQFPASPLLRIRALSARAAVFDVDYTVLQQSSTIAFAKVAIKHKLIPPLRLVDSAILHFQVKYGLAHPSRLPRSLPFLSGIPRDLLDDLGEEVFIRYLIKSIYPDAIALIRDYRERGALVVLATASLDFIISPLADFLEIPPNHVVTTKLQYDANGICNGEVDGRPCYGLEKLRRTHELLQARRIRLEDSAFYSDSILDVGMMKRVGYPVATNPDMLLGRRARKSGWEIVRFA